MRHTCSDISAFCWKLCKGQEYVCIRLWTTPQPHSTQRPTLAPAKIKGSFASARSGSHRYVCNKRARCTRKAFSKVPKCLKHIKLNCGSILYFIWLASEMHGVSLIVLIVAHAQRHLQHAENANGMQQPDEGKLSKCRKKLHEDKGLQLQRNWSNSQRTSRRGCTMT